MKTRTILAVLTASFVLFAHAAHAGTLIGQTISAEYDNPNVGTVLCTSCFTTNPFVVGAGIETSINFTSQTFDFSADQLVITNPGGIFFIPQNFNGVVFTLA